MNRIWKINSYQSNKTFDIENLLFERGIKTAREKKLYFEANFGDLSNPYLLPEMEKAAKRIKKAIDNKEKILIYGDYDVDGITSTALFYRFFKKTYNINLEYFLPDRIKNGYGLNIASLKQISTQNVDLIITVDCGITAFKEADFLAAENIDLIITDHHTPLNKLPKAEAVINHHLIKTKDYLARDLAGVGTAFKLIQALNIVQTKNMAAELLPLTALGTVADLVPLKGENRILVKKGLVNIKYEKILGLKILIEKLGVDKKRIKAGQIAFIIAPPLNAAGRIADAEQALKLLITEDRDEAKIIADKLIQINRKRQKEEVKIYQEAEEKIKKLNLEKEKSIILADENWHSGIIGIVASKLLEKYHLPVILFAIDSKNEIAKGSARSISALNIYKTLKLSADTLLDFGGHSSAAGLSIAVNKIADFKSEFNDNIEKFLDQEDFLAKKTIDLNLNLSQINKKFIQDLEDFRPFGIANPAPKFIFQNIKARACYQIGKENKHLKLYLDNGIQAIAFNLGNKVKEIKNSKIDLIAEPEINYWQGQENIQLKVKDYRLSNEISTVLLFKNNGYSFYDCRNSAEKYSNLKDLLTKSVIKKAAVYINNKKIKKELEIEFPKHYFFGSEYNFKKNYSHLFFYSLPFSLQQLNLIIQNYNSGIAQKNKKIFLLFNQKDIEYNERLINYKNRQEENANLTNELDFEDSVRYNKLSERLKKFKILKKYILKNNLFVFINKLCSFKEDYENES